MRVVLDCNVLVVCLTSRSPYHFIYQSLVAAEYDLAVTPEILLEYEEIITQKYGVATAKALLALLTELPNVQFIQTYYQWKLITTDPDDNKYCDCAIASNANYIVTEDKHFSALANIPFPKIHTLNIDELAKLLRPRN